MGRKSIDGEPKENVIPVRLADSEHAELKAAAELADKPLSTWARDALLAAARDSASSQQAKNGDKKSSGKTTSD